MPRRNKDGESPRSTLGGSTPFSHPSNSINPTTSPTKFQNEDSRATPPSPPLNTWTSRVLLLPGIWRIAVLAGDDFDLLRADDLVGLHFERRVLYYECPDFVAKPVGREMALEGRDAGRRGNRRGVEFEVLERGYAVDLVKGWVIWYERDNSVRGV